MTKQARKVALINVHDYNRDNYRAYYEIRVLGTEEEGYEWGVRIYGRKDFVKTPTGKMLRAKDEFGEDIPNGQGGFVEYPEVVRHCKVLEEALDVAASRDEADTAAQMWVKEHMEKYRLPPKPVSKEAGFALALGPGWMLSAIVLDLFGFLRRLFEELFGPMFALAYSATVRNTRLNQITAAIDGGAGAGLWRIYDGSRPATCGTATTLLAELTMSDPSAAAASGGVLTFNAITADASANATGTAAWFRIVDSTGTCCVDGNVGTSGSDLNLNSLSISSGQEVAITSATITEGNV